jgi:hypothetical protein
VLGIKLNPGEIAEKEDGRNVVAAVPGGSQTVFRKIIDHRESNVHRKVIKVQFEVGQKIGVG